MALVYFDVDMVTPSLPDVEYRFYNNAGQGIGDWTHTGVNEELDGSTPTGIYGVLTTQPTDAVVIRWRRASDFTVRASKDLTTPPPPPSILSPNNIDSNSAVEIWRDTGLPVEAINVFTTTDAVNRVKTDILPDVIGYVNSRVEEASIPFGYPLTTEIIQSAYPDLTVESLTTILQGWNIDLESAVKYFAMADLFLFADSLNEEYRKKAADLRALGESFLTSLLANIRRTIDLVPNNSTNGKLGLLTLKLKKNKPGLTQYPWGYRGLYPYY